jgi:hypothetical protein
MSFYNVHGDRLYTSFAALWSIFINTAYDARLGGVYCILDALDECEEQSRAELIQQIGCHFSGTLVARSGQREWAGLKLIITSRPYDDIRIRLSQFTVIRLKAEQEEKSINDDIALYITHEVHNLAKLRGYTEDLTKHVHNELWNGAHGMFLWVYLMIRILETTAVGDVRQKLKCLRAGIDKIDKIYIRVLEKIPEDSKKALSNILKWVVFASRTLTLDELGVACAIAPGCKSFSSIPAEQRNGIRGDVELCGPILKIQDDGSVRLVHQTTKEFLL